MTTDIYHMHFMQVYFYKDLTDLNLIIFGHIHISNCIFLLILGSE